MLGPSGSRPGFLKAIAIALVAALVATAGAQATLRIAEHAGPHVQPMEEYFIPRHRELTGVNVIMEVTP